MKCDGWSDEEILQHYADLIDQYGWAIVGVGGGRNTPPFAYTVGLTRYHDHPELIVSGMAGRDAAAMLNPLAEHVRDGHRYSVGDVIVSFTPHRHQLLRVNDPSRLVYAQEMYGVHGAQPVPALQVAWTNHDGLWPWDSRWAERRQAQELFGRPPRKTP